MRTNFNIPGENKKHVIVEVSWFGRSSTDIMKSSEQDNFVSMNQLIFDLGIIRLDIAIFGEKETQQQLFWRS